jgi:hypothetical protein
MFFMGGAALLLVASGLIGQREPKEQEAPPVSKPDLASLFYDRDSWGKDFPQALACIASWNEIKQESVSVFRDEVVGSKPYKDVESARSACKILNEALAKGHPPFRERFAGLFRELRDEKSGDLRAKVVEFFPDDDSIRCALVSPSLSLLPKELTIASVHRRFGRPDKVSRKVIRGERGERRPVILTLHSYASGAVQFAESDWSAQPGTVDRVILHVPVVSAALFEDSK